MGSWSPVGQRQCYSKQVQSEYEDSNFSPSLYMFTSFSNSVFYTKGVRYVGALKT